MTITVVSIIGKGRSGSTLLDMALGSQPGWFSAGELWHRVGYPPFDRMGCGCGKKLGDCSVWAMILERLESELGPSETLELDRLERSVHRWSNVPRILEMGANSDGRLMRMGDYARALYSAIADVTGARVIVDSSKWPFHPAVMGLDGIDRVSIHLVRDPRAVAVAWQRDVVQGGQRLLPKHSSLHSAVSWLARNMFAGVVGGPDVHRLRYEDLASDPGSALATISAMVNDEASEPRPSFGHRICVGENHIVKGNPSKRLRGEVRIAVDDRWRNEQPALQELLVWALCGRLARSYGYRWREFNSPSSRTGDDAHRM